MNIRLFHISIDDGMYRNEDHKNLYPRIPRNAYQDECGNIIEDVATKRICMSPTIMGCIRAIYDTYGDGNYAVYEANVSDSDVLMPDERLVPDVAITRETWVLKDVCAQLAFYISVSKKRGVLRYSILNLETA